MINKIIDYLPIKIANSTVAYLILKSTVKHFDKYYQNVKLRYPSTIKMDLCSKDIGHQYLAFTGVYENALTLTKRIIGIKTQNNGLMVDVDAN